MLIPADFAVTAQDGPAQGAPVISARQLEPDELARRLSWQDGMLSFDGETLADAAAEFRRYSPTRIVIEDPAQSVLNPLGSTTITLTPNGFVSTASTRLKPSTANFAAW